MTKAFIILGFIAFANHSYAQSKKYPDGEYMTIEQLRIQSPELHLEFQVTRRSREEIGLSGGNEYKLGSDSVIKYKHFIKNSIYAYTKNDSIYLNCMQHKLQEGYALCVTRGAFFVFKAAMSKDEVDSFSDTSHAAAKNKQRLYVLSLRTGKAKPLTKEYLTARLRENLSLSDQFNKEKDQESEAILITYIDLLNEVTSPNSSAPPK